MRILVLSLQKGVILYGEPGSGKTFLAKAVASSTSATFLHVVGSELIQKYLGDGPKLVRELFRVADELSPSIVFIDEIDAVGTKREFKAYKWIFQLSSHPTYKDTFLKKEELIFPLQCLILSLIIYNADMMLILAKSVKYRKLCWNCQTSWMILSQGGMLRSFLQLIELKVLIQPCFSLIVLTGIFFRYIHLGWKNLL